MILSREGCAAGRVSVSQFDERGISQIRVSRSNNGIDGSRTAERSPLEPDIPEYLTKSGAARTRGNPRMMLARASEWVFAPEAHYQQSGLLPAVVYTCGTISRGDEIWMYYGAADTVVGLAIGNKRTLLDFVHKHDFLERTGRSKGMVC